MYGHRVSHLCTTLFESTLSPHLHCEFYGDNVLAHVSSKKVSQGFHCMLQLRRIFLEHEYQTVFSRFNSQDLTQIPDLSLVLMVPIDHYRVRAFSLPLRSSRLSSILLPGGSNKWMGFFFGFWANLALYGCLLVNEATGQVRGYGFGQVLTKHISFSEDTAQCHRLWRIVVVACASEQTRSVCPPRFPPPNR